MFNNQRTTFIQKRFWTENILCIHFLIFVIKPYYWYPFYNHKSYYNILVKKFRNKLILVLITNNIYILYIYNQRYIFVEYLLIRLEEINTKIKINNRY